ncbi:MAG TPA: hypothetical protein VIQ05_22655 [Tardiphaga sp.]
MSRTDKRDRFISEIREEARALGLSFRVDYRKGKGGHAMVYVGDKLTTLPSREIDPKTARKIRKHLGLGDRNGRLGQIERIGLCRPSATRQYLSLGIGGA